MKKMAIIDIVDQLLGPIIPAGDASVDGDRFKNLNDYINLIKVMLEEVDYIASMEDDLQHSIARAGIYAKNFLDEIKEYNQ
jgi:hypothetical protein